MHVEKVVVHVYRRQDVKFMRLFRKKSNRAFMVRQPHHKLELYDKDTYTVYLSIFFFFL